MTIAQGIAKTVAIKVQSGLGVPAAGSGGQLLRRRTGVGTRNRDTYESDEIVSHQQSTGAVAGGVKAAYKLDCLISAGSYAMLWATILRKAFAATAALTGQSITIAGTSPGPYTLTRTGGTDYLAAGLKIGDVIRITAGTYTNAVNRDNNLLITALTATVATVYTLNGTVLIAEGPIASSTVTVIGKKTLAPTSGHTSEYWTVEDFYADLTKSELFTDTRFTNAAVTLPATGNAGVVFDGMAIDRTLGGAQVLTTPTAATTTDVVAGINGKVIVNGAVVGNLTGLNFTIDGGGAYVGPVVGSNIAPDISRGRIKVGGQFTALFDGTTIQAVYDSQAAINLVCVIAADGTNTSDFVGFSMSKVKVMGDAPDDGEKGITRTYPFVAAINGAGGAALANDQTIITIQDSAAP